jgi:ubiquitin C-terminal hydrolase
MQCLNATRDLVMTFALAKRDSFKFTGDSMNSLLRNFFLDIRSVGQMYNPQPLFSGVCLRNSRFRGFQQ